MKATSKQLLFYQIEHSLTTRDMLSATAVSSKEQRHVDTLLHVLLFTHCC